MILIIFHYFLEQVAGRQVLINSAIPAYLHGRMVNHPVHTNRAIFRKYREILRSSILKSSEQYLTQYSHNIRISRKYQILFSTDCLQPS